MERATDMNGWVEKLTYADLLLLFAVAVCVVFMMARRGFDDLYALRRRRRDRAAQRGPRFPVVPRPVLPHDDNGPGVYEVTGVLERTGTPTRFDVTAASAADALRQAIERGVSPAAATKRRADGEVVAHERQ